MIERGCDSCFADPRASTGAPPPDGFRQKKKALLGDLLDARSGLRGARSGLARLSRLADTQLSVALSREPVGDQIELRLFPLQGGQVALACDLHTRTVSNYRAEIEAEAGSRQLRLPL